jgi:hypothetical protein
VTRRGDASCSPRVRICAWCEQPIPLQARRDAVCCSTRCRQARHRFRSAVGLAVAHGRPLKLAYADPPYPGKAWLYRDHPDFAGEVDHVELIRRLSTYDGWALSTSAAALPSVLASCPPGVRVAAWHRGERPTRSAGPLNGWEPVIYFGGRAQLPSAIAARRVDSLVYFSRPRLTDPRRVVGAKPAAFARWVFELLGASAYDTLDDLFPGSGGVRRAWLEYTSAGGRDASLEVLHDASLADEHDASCVARADASRGSVPDALRPRGATAAGRDTPNAR